MYKKLAALLLFLASALVMSGCSKDAEINAFLTELDSFTAELVKKVDAAPTSTGIDAAQKYFDSQKASLQEKWNGIKDARGFQVSEETKKKMMDSVTKNFTAVKELELKYMSKSMEDADFKSKLEKLTKDYEDLFKM